MQYTQSKNGYFYQITKKGEKKRISKILYDKKMMKGGVNNHTTQLVPLFNFLKDKLKGYNDIKIINQQDHIEINNNEKIVTVWIWLGNFRIKDEETSEFTEIPIGNVHKNIIDTVKKYIGIVNNNQSNL